MKNFALVLAAALLLTPLTLAHEPRGTYKNYCEPPGGEWLIHDYKADASARFLVAGTDGNWGGDCSGVFDPGYVCAGLDPEDPLNTFLIGICDFDPPLADGDGHHEWAYGGAWLLVNSGAGIPSPDPNLGAGTLFCFAEQGHHATFATVAVDDVALGFGTSFWVGVDIIDLTGTGRGCGDGFADQSQECVGSCTVTFPPGLDGSYHVHVRGTVGHVYSN